MVFLPCELINEILTKLPLKSVVRFKCVCKSWLSLISDPQFALSHFEGAVAARQQKLVFLTPYGREFRSIDLNASFHDDDCASAPLNLNFLSLCSCHVSIHGSCRGFLLLYIRRHRRFYVWNPFTGVHKQVSFSPLTISSSLFGFGYDPLTDDYLVVHASYNLYYHATCAQFFSLRANVWKQIEIEATHLSYKPFSFHTDNQTGWLFKAAIHWLAFNFDVSMNVILAFDLMERSFSEIPLPFGFEYHNFELCILRVLGELLNLCGVRKNNSVEIWEMKEYKVQSSWTKTVVISFDDIPIQKFFPICSTKNGDIVGIDRRFRLKKFNDKGQLLEHQSFDGAYGSTVAVYTESLFSLPCDNKQAEEDDV